MNNFISTFFACLFACGVAIFFFVTNIWAMVVLVSLILAVFITIFMNQESRTEELEKKMEQLLNKKQD